LERQHPCWHGRQGCRRSTENMKKQNAYTIKDDIFLEALRILHEHFQDVPYAIVGGGAVQVYVASTTIRETRLKSVKELNGLSIMLRKTGDVDLSFHVDEIELIRNFNHVIAQAAGKYTFHSFAKRFVVQDGSQRFNLNYQTEPDDLKGIPAYYYDIIQTAIPVELPYKNDTLRLKLARPEYLIVSKLTRIKQKDQFDITLLLRSMELNEYPFDSEEVRSILKSINKLENYDILAEIMEAG
jgi:hypothetical protein